MAVESPNKLAISPLKFFNRTAKVDQKNSVITKEKLTQIDYSLKGILSIKQRDIKTSRLEEEETQRQEKEKKLESGKFFVKGVGKLANVIPGKNTIQKFLLFMAFGWLFNTFSKYFGELGEPLANILGVSSKVIDTFSQVALTVFNGFVTFVDLGYKAYDVMRGVESPEKFQGALNDMIVGIDNFFGGILQQLGIVQDTETTEPTPRLPGITPGAPGAAPGSEKPGYYGPPTPTVPSTTPSPGDKTGKPGVQPQTPMVPQAPGQTFTGGVLPSTILGSKAGMRDHPLSGGMKMHRGNDYPIDPGTQISVIKGGKVTRSEVNGSMTSGYGNLIEIQHDDGSKSAYAHLNQRNVSVGDVVKPGTVIGTVGSTGGSTGSHLHFEYDHPNGKGETNWQSINSKADQIFRFGNVKPSDVYKLALKDGVEGAIINGEWKAQKWTKEERDRYLRVRGLKEQAEEQISSSSSGYEKAALDMIAVAEGTTKSYGTMFGGRVNQDLAAGKLTVKEAIQLGDMNARQYGSGATGRYQFMPSTLEDLVRVGALKMDEKFTPKKQDEAAKFLAKGRGVDITKPLMEKDIYRLGGVWASLEGGPEMKAGGYYSYNGRSQVKYDAKKALEIYQSKLKTSSTAKTSPQLSPQQTSKPERWAIDPRGWFGMKGGGVVDDIPRQTKTNDVSSLESYPSYSPESGESMQVVIQPVIIKVPTPSGRSRLTDFPVAIGVNNSMSNLSNLSQG